MLRIYTVIIVDFVWEIPPLLFTEMPAPWAIMFNYKRKVMYTGLSPGVMPVLCDEP